MKPIAVIPTLCTLGNAFCGFLAISKGADAVAALQTVDGSVPAASLVRFQELMTTACWLVFLAMVFDALDGRIARMTHQTSDFGAYLDSLTDMLTFGAAPALLLKFAYENLHGSTRPKAILVLTVLYVCCAALRLARFTAETEEDPEAHDFFQGLPTPAAAGLLCSSLLMYCSLQAETVPGQAGFLTNLVGSLSSLSTDDAQAAIGVFADRFLLVLIFIPAILGLLMVSGVRYIHLVNRYMRGKRPYAYVAQVVFILFLVAIEPALALFGGFLMYVLACPLLAALENVSGRNIVPRTPLPGDGGNGP